MKFPGATEPRVLLALRGVEMVREGSRNPTSTLFVTDATVEELPTEQVATAYLSRWPHQERRFRDARNGLGLDRSHGYGGHDVTHVALSTAQEKAAARVVRAEASVVAKAAAETVAAKLWDAVEKEQRGASGRVPGTTRTTSSRSRSRQRQERPAAALYNTTGNLRPRHDA